MKYLHKRLVNYSTGHENKEVVILKYEMTVLAVRQTFVVLNGVQEKKQIREYAVLIIVNFKHFDVGRLMAAPVS